MAEWKEARVPDIGNYDGVPVIELLVAVGDTVAADQGLVTLESDKATMEVPAPFAGVVRELKVKIGDELAEGSVVALIEPSEAAGGGAADPRRAAGAGCQAGPGAGERAGRAHRCGRCPGTAERADRAVRAARRRGGGRGRAAHAAGRVHRR